MSLDRKTKDIDASIELLEDRTKLNDIYLIMAAVLAFIWAVIMILGVLVLDRWVAFSPTKYTLPELIQRSTIITTGSIFLCAIAITIFIFAMKFINEGYTNKKHYSLLIYLKRQFEKENKT